MTEELIHKVVDEISFGLISPKDLRKQSVVEIQTPDTYDEDGAPITAGLMDGRLGTLEPRQRCKTCGNTAIRCPGHFGHIELAVPIVHIEFTKIIFDLLKATCRSCGRILLSEDAAKSQSMILPASVDTFTALPRTRTATERTLKSLSADEANNLSMILPVKATSVDTCTASPRALAAA